MALLLINEQGTGDTLFCPTKILGKIVKRRRNYKGVSDNTPISAVWKEMTAALHNAVEAFGQRKLGIRKGGMGTHSIRSAVTMEMYIGQCPVYVIMMIG